MNDLTVTPACATADANGARPCPVCGGTESTPLDKWSKGPWQNVRCSGCGMVFLRNPPPPELLKSELDWDVLKNHERARRRAARGAGYYLVSDGIKRVRAFARGFVTKKEYRYIQRYAEGPRILDVGCGGGHILAGMPGPIVPFGIEPSPGMQQQADASFRARGGFCIHNIAHLGLRELPEAVEFDFILMRSFLEHDVMAEETLLSCHAKLAPQGKVLIKVPNFACWSARLRGAGWPGIRCPDHVNYFTPDSLAGLLQRCGFSRTWIPLVWRLPTSDNLWALAYR